MAHGLLPRLHGPHGAASTLSHGNARRPQPEDGRKLAVVTAGMFAFGYALIPLYKHICELTGINILALGESRCPAASTARPIRRST
jgi:cytochrome c oxidase assembly protein Cox11